MRRGAATFIDTPLGKMTRADAAMAFAIPINTIHSRIHRGLSTEEVFAEPRLPGERAKDRQAVKLGYLTAWGRLSLAEIAKILGISAMGLYDRIYRGGWPHEIAFNTPPLGVPGQHFIMAPEEYRKRCVNLLRAEKVAMREKTVKRSRDREVTAPSRASEFNGGRSVGPKTCMQDGVEHHACQE